MIPEIWTLQAASGGPTRTLADWGFTTATLTRASQAADVLTLTAPVADALAPDLWPWETEIILRRDGAVWYRGYLADVAPSLDGQSESKTYTFKSLWWLLERCDFLQDAETLTSSRGFVVAKTGQVRMEGRSGGQPGHVPSMVAELVTAAAQRGVTLSVNAGGLGSHRIPVIEAHNRTVADLLRDIFRWLPDTTLIAEYGEEGTAFRAVRAGSASVVEIPVGDRPLSTLAIREMREMQTDKVRVVYETSATHTQTRDGGMEVGGGFSRAKVRVIKEDIYPAAAPDTLQTLTVTLPHPAPPTGGGGDPPTPQVTSQPVATETWPEDGSTGQTVEKWWLDRSGLAALGLTTNDVRVATSSDGETMAHKVILDPAVPIEPPSAVNPESTPVWRPPKAEDTPRELIAGSLSDWMNVQSAMCIARATIGIRKSTADNLEEPHLSAFRRLGARVGKVLGVDAYLLDAQYRFRATDAVTKVYSKTLSIDYGGAGDGAANSAAYHEAVAAAVVPGLAQRLYAALSPLYHAGSVSLAAEEVAHASYMDQVVRLVHASRPDWASMRAVVQGEEADLVTGEVRLTLGPPEHLSPQDWVALHAAARTVHAGRKSAAGGSSGPPPAPSDEPDESNSQSPVIGGTFTPQSQFERLGGGAEAKGRWDLIPAESGGHTLRAPLLVASLSALGDPIVITNSPITLQADRWVVLSCNDVSADPQSYTLAIRSEEEGELRPYTFSSGDNPEVTGVHLPLWRIAATESPGSVPLGEDLHGTCYVGPGALTLVGWGVNPPGTSRFLYVPRLSPL